MGSFKRVRGNRIRDIPEEKAEPADGLKTQLNNMFMEEFDRNQFNAWHGVSGGMWADEPLEDKPEEEDCKTHFFGYNQVVGEDLNEGIVDWSVTTKESTGEIDINANHSTSTVTITESDNTDAWSSGEIYIGDGLDIGWQRYGDNLDLVGDGGYIGDPPEPEVQTFDGFGNLIAPTPMQYQQPYTIQPNTITTTGAFNFGLNKNEKYAVVELDREDVPMAVYICGRMLTLGILGTAVECAFTGNKLVFEPGVVSAIAFGNRITMSIEYDDEIRHYNIGTAGQVTYISDQSSTMDITIVSTIVKKKGSSLSGEQ